MLIAQALGEYGVGSLVNGISNLILDGIDAITSLDPSTYAVIVVVSFLVWFFVGRR